MKPLVDIFKVLVGDVSVNLCSRYITVSQQRLNGSQICAIHQQISGKTMTHGVRADMFCYAGQPSILANHSLNTAGA